MSTVAIVLLALGVILLLLFIGGLVAARRRTVAGAGEYAEHVAAADQALEQARANDRGWDRERLEDLARGAIAEHRPGWRMEALHLILVEDLPGVRQDRAHFMAEGSGADTRVVLERSESGNWSVAKVE